MDNNTLKIDLIMPKSWHELNDKQLRYAFGLIAQVFTFDAIKTLCLFRWSGLSVRHRHNADFVCRLRSTPYRHSLSASLVSVATAHFRLTFPKCRLRNSSFATTSIKAISPRSRTTCSSKSQASSINPQFPFPYPRLKEFQSSTGSHRSKAISPSVSTISFNHRHSQTTCLAAMHSPPAHKYSSLSML